MISSLIPSLPSLTWSTAPSVAVGNSSPGVRRWWSCANIKHLILHCLPVKAGNCSLTLGHRCHFNEPESPGLPAVLVFYNVYRRYLSKTRKFLTQLLFSNLMRQVTYINFHISVPPSV